MANQKKYLYAGSYTNEDAEETLGIYSIFPLSGEILKIDSLSECKNPNFLARLNERLYVLDEDEEKNYNAIAVFAIKEGKKLLLLQKVEIHGSGACHVAVDSMGKYVYYANYISGDIGRVELDEDGLFKKSHVEKIQHKGHSMTVRQESAHPHEVYLWEKENLLIVPDLGLDQLVFYRTDKERLEQVSIVHVECGDGPRHVYIHPNNRWLYLLCEISNKLYVFEWDKQQGFTEKQCYSVIPEKDGKEYIGGEIIVTEDGKYVITCTRAWGEAMQEEGVICCHSIMEDGCLEEPAYTKSGGCHPRMITMTQNEEFLIVSNQYSNNIVGFTFDKNTGGIEYCSEAKAINVACVII